MVRYFLFLIFLFCAEQTEKRLTLAEISTFCMCLSRQRSWEDDLAKTLVNQELSRKIVFVKISKFSYVIEIAHRKKKKKEKRRKKYKREKKRNTKFTHGGERQNFLAQRILVRRADPRCNSLTLLASLLAGDESLLFFVEFSDQPLKWRINSVPVVVTCVAYIGKLAWTKARIKRARPALETAGRY